MTVNGDSMDLSGKLLVAMPGLGDSRFSRAVIFVCAHSGDGTMGLVVNRPAPDVEFTELLEQLGIDRPEGPEAALSLPIHFGGPVETGRGFVLHSGDYSASEATLPVDAAFAMTATLEILEDITRGTGPERALLALGYAGWGPGQLESEILENGWLICNAAPDLVFGGEDARKWGRALQSIGVDPESLSAAAGRA